MSANAKRRGILQVIGPGLLVAATGVGAGDLATAGIAGSRLGVAVLWAVLVGAVLKLVLTEGLARYQLATGETLLEGTVGRLGKWVGWLFVPYLVLWSFFVGSALMSANGVALHALLPVFDEPSRGKVAFGLAASAIGLVLVWNGGYRAVERVMSVCVGVMFATVVVTAALLIRDPGALLRGMLVPTIVGTGSGWSWTVALIGGIGGTVTVLCYGYWIREEGRTGAEALRTCRIDLGTGYAVTALFGLAMVVVGSTVQLEGGGAELLVRVADRLAGPLGPAGRWAFLIGAAGAVLSSLLGVWQAVPYLFADLWYLLMRQSAGSQPAAVVNTRAWPYRGCLLALATLPVLGLFVEFQRVQKVYAVAGAAFMPLLALVLLVLAGRASWMGRLRNRWPSVIGLLATLGFFAFMAWRKWTG